MRRGNEESEEGIEEGKEGGHFFSSSRKMGPLAERLAVILVVAVKVVVVVVVVVVVLVMVVMVAVV